MRDELLGVVLGDDRLEDFITDRRQNTLVVVLTDVVKDHMQLFFLRSEEDSQGDVNRLQVFGTGG